MGEGEAEAEGEGEPEREWEVLRICDEKQQDGRTYYKYVSFAL